MLVPSYSTIPWFNPMACRLADLWKVYACNTHKAKLMHYLNFCWAILLCTFELRPPDEMAEKHYNMRFVHWQQKSLHQDTVVLIMDCFQSHLPKWLPTVPFIVMTAKWWLQNANKVYQKSSTVIHKSHKKSSTKSFYIVICSHSNRAYRQSTEALNAETVMSGYFYNSHYGLYQSHSNNSFYFPFSFSCVAWS